MNDEGINKPDAPPKQSVVAVIGGILGLISLFIGIFAGVPAVIFGHIALISVSRSAGRIAGRGLAIFALVMGYLSIAVFVFFRLN